MFDLFRDSTNTCKAPTVFPTWYPVFSVQQWMKQMWPLLAEAFDFYRKKKQMKKKKINVIVKKRNNPDKEAEWGRDRVVREGYSVELRSIQRMRFNGKPEGSLPGRGSQLCNRAWEALKSKGEQRAGAEAEQDKTGRQAEASSCRTR